MASFDYYNSKARRQYLARKNFSQGVFWASMVLVIILLLVSIYLFFQSVTFLAGLGQLLFGLGLAFQGYLLAKKYRTSNLKATDNIVDQFSPELFDLFEATIEEARKENVTSITPEYLFTKMSLLNSEAMIEIRLGLPLVKPSKNRPTGSVPVFSPALISITEKLNPQNQIEIEDFLALLVQSSEAIQSALFEHNLTKKDLAIIFNWLKSTKKRLRKPKFWQDEVFQAGIGQDWSYGYTPVLSLYSEDLSRYFSNTNLEINIFSHAGKLDEIETVLAKTNKNNVLLTGEPGVGKQTIINALALKLARGDCLPVLKYKRIRELNIGKLLAGADAGTVRARLEGSLSDAVGAGNIILYINNFQSLLGGSAAANDVGGVDASQILIPYLESSNLRIIASVSPDDYFSVVRRRAGIEEAMEKIEVAAPEPEDVPPILLESVNYVEYKYNVFYPYQTLKKIVELSARYIHEVPFPEKALRLLEESAVGLQGEKIKIVTPADIESLVSKRTNVPIGEVGEKEKDRLLNLESILHQRVIGQDEAINAVANALRRVRSGLTTGKRPAGVFLFLGPTGVGKTETAKALAESYFGSEKNMIRLDMSEYEQPDSLDRLIGTVENPAGILTDAILAKPFSLILLDELEKADKNVLNVFLQVFEDGRLTDPRGKVSDFTNCIIIGTSNAGSEFIRENVGRLSAEQLKTTLIDQLQKQAIFTPEFLNRFDGVITFKPLTRENLTLVAGLMIGEINKQLEERKIRVEVESAALAKLIELGYNQEFGARPLRRVMEEKIENLLAKKMLEGVIKEHGVLHVSLSDIS